MAKRRTALMETETPEKRIEVIPKEIEAKMMLRYIRLKSKGLRL